MKKFLKTTFIYSILGRNLLFLLVVLFFASCEEQAAKDWILGLEDGIPVSPAPEGIVSLEFDLADLQGDPAFLFDPLQNSGSVDLFLIALDFDSPLAGSLVQIREVNGEGGRVIFQLTPAAGGANTMSVSVDPVTEEISFLFDYGSETYTGRMTLTSVTKINRTLYVGSTMYAGSFGSGTDVDGDGYFAEEDDCDDTNGLINPGATELNDGIDNNCDGYIDEGFEICGDGVTTGVEECDDGNSVEGDGCYLCMIEPDADGDGIPDVVDPAPNDAFICGDSDADTCDDCANGSFDPNNDGTDTDADGICDAGDPDDDNDGCEDGQDSAPLVADVDTDGDSIGDSCDVCPYDAENDSDGDGVCGDLDVCPAIPNPDQSDLDADGIGDVCDVCFGNDALGDEDGDGVCDDLDICQGSDDNVDTDADLVPDGCDICLGDDVSGDADGDGYCADVDCDDIDANINPSATDAAGSGIDANCDGEYTWFEDLDLDGFGSTVTLLSFNSSPGIGESNISTDCNDNDADINPAATDVDGSGIDANCDGQYSGPETNEKIFGYGIEPGGNPYNGFIYSSNLQGTSFNIEYTFSDATGRQPAGNLIAVGTDIIGTTAYGGQYSNGVLYKYSTTTGQYLVLHEFDLSPNGSPVYGITKKGDVLYGLTNGGGTYGQGILYSFELTTNTFTSLYDFESSMIGEGNDLTIENGVVHGALGHSGRSGCGELFTLDLSTKEFTQLLEFDFSNGCGSSLPFLYDGKMIGTSFALYSYDLSDDSFTNLSSFDVTTGTNPRTAFLSSNGKIYLRLGFNGLNGEGGIYEYDPVSATGQTVFYFDTDDNQTGTGQLVEIGSGEFLSYVYSGDWSSYRLLHINTNNGTSDVVFEVNTGLIGSLYGTPVLIQSDSDNDGVTDDLDNCIDVSNADQLDVDADGIGDVCDICFGDNATGDADGDGYCANIDCDDNDAEINAEASDVAGSGIDANCDGQYLWFADIDEDSYGSTSTIVSTNSTAGVGESATSDDCDDSDSGINPGATDVAGSGIDANCDGDYLWYVDTDEDGFGSMVTISSVNSTAGDGESASSDDCDDTNDLLNPETVWYQDADEDGYGDLLSTEVGCEQPTGYVSSSDDCDDTVSEINPDATDVAGSGIDANCDGQYLWFVDDDGDTYGTSTTVSSANTSPGTGESATSDDCDDTNDLLNPGAIDVAGSGVDSNCDSNYLWFEDLDSDGYGSLVEISSTNASPEAGESATSDDCNDSDATVYPGAIALPDGKDNNCDGIVDLVAQTISFNVLEDVIDGTEAVELTATATSELPVSYSVEGPATLEGSTLTLTGAGSVTVTASQGGDDGYLPAEEVLQSFCINPVPQITMDLQGFVTVTLTSNYSDGNQWYKDGTQISGATTQSIAGSGAGMYRVEVTIDGCVGESEETALVLTGNFLEEFGQKLQVYPTPVRNQLFVEVGDIPVATYTLRVLDVNGKTKLYEKIMINSGTSTYQINVQELNAGVYTMLLESGENVYVKKIVKE